MNRALLDTHVPGWEALSPIEFRWAVNELDAQLRPVLRSARELVAPHEVPAAEGSPAAPTPAPLPPAPLPTSKRRKAHPTE